MKKPPCLIAINSDEYHAKHVGRTPDGRQFFLTNPFVPATKGSAGREFIALYLFDARGGLVEARIDDLGTRTNFDQDAARKVFKRRLEDLGSVVNCRIEVQPFELDRFGVKFGLIARPPEDEDDSWWVEAQPGNFMAFCEPFDSGDYDT